VNAYIESYFGFKFSFRWWTVAVLLGFICFFRVLAYLALSKLNFQVGGRQGVLWVLLWVLVWVGADRLLPLARTTQLPVGGRLGMQCE